MITKVLLVENVLSRYSPLPLRWVRYANKRSKKVNEQSHYGVLMSIHTLQGER